MHIYWCRITPLLHRPEPFLGWCAARGLSLAHYLCLDDALRHLAGLQLRRLAARRPQRGTQVSISHSGGLVVCAQGFGPLGIDTEALCAPRAPLPLDVFPPEEVHWIRRQRRPLAAFLQLWTRKEALLKARGGALSQMPDLPALVEGGKLLHRLGPLCLEPLPILPRQYVTSLCRPQGGPAAVTHLAAHRLFPR